MAKNVQYQTQRHNDTIDYVTFSNNLAKFDTKSFKLDIYYPKSDSRCWTALINAGTDNCIVTYHINKNHYGDQTFDILASQRTYIDVGANFIYDTLDEILTSEKYNYAAE